MDILALIEKKKKGIALNEQEIKDWILAYINDEIYDYQVSSLLMAICLKGMTLDETAILCREMKNSGESIDLSSLNTFVVDKHSTGGVGDKTSLVLAPLAAACGVCIAKMSGRGLGHTGGTIDKLESIEGFQVEQSMEAFIKQVKDIGLAIISQSQKLVPADKKLYALRDVSGTVDSIPLIASSIMSKKLACGANAILLDVKWGDGAFMKTIEDAISLAETMIYIGEANHVKVKAMITDMNQPLGNAIGNAVEVKEAIATLLNKGPKDLTNLCIEAVAIMMELAFICTIEEGRQKAKKALEDGSAFCKFKEMVQAQGGNIDVIMHPEKLPTALYQTPIHARKKGYIHQIKAQNLGRCAMLLKAGRAHKDEQIDHRSGMILNVKVGDQIAENDVLVYLEHSEPLTDDLIQTCLECFIIKDERIEERPFIQKIL